MAVVYEFFIGIFRRTRIKLYVPINMFLLYSLYFGQSQHPIFVFKAIAKGWFDLVLHFVLGSDVNQLESISEKIILNL